MAVKKYTSEELSDWLNEKAQATEASISRRILTLSDERSQPTALIGRLYFFKYDPKFKHKLDRYDKFPMCFPFKRTSDGFLGLNLHYLSGGERAALVGSMMRFTNNERFDETTRFNINYDVLQSTYNLRSLSSPCIHRYIFSHCRSRFIEIYAYEYDKAIQLPVEDWVFRR